MEYREFFAWVTNCRSDRQQKNVVEGVYSDWLSVTSGAPQGSILCPLLFLVYINDAPDFIQHNSSIALSADISITALPLAIGFLILEKSMS